MCIRDRFNFAPPTVKYHCISRYPAKPEECNLDATFDNTYSGWSDHTANPGVIYNAVFGYHLSYIEFHLDLDGEGNEYKHGHCWLPNDMAEVIRNIKSGLEAEGTSNHNTVDKEREDLKDLMWKPETGKR
jgi:N-acetylneuraminate synthase